MARSPLEEELKKNGCDMPIADFMDIVESVQKKEYGQFSVDSLMQHPSEAVAYCERIKRYQPNFAELSENLILRCLMARRKNPV